MEWRLVSPFHRVIWSCDMGRMTLRDAKYFRLRQSLSPSSWCQQLNNYTNDRIALHDALHHHRPYVLLVKFVKIGRVYFLSYLFFYSHSSLISFRITSQLLLNCDLSFSSHLSFYKLFSRVYSTTTRPTDMVQLACVAVHKRRCSPYKELVLFTVIRTGHCSFLFLLAWVNYRLLHQRTQNMEYFKPFFLVHLGETSGTVYPFWHKKKSEKRKSWGWQELEVN